MRTGLGHNVLGQMMKQLSGHAGLEGSYTNHCVRASVISRMKKAGIEERKFCSVSGHKNVQSLQAYDRVTSSEAKRLSEVIDVRPMRAMCPATVNVPATTEESAMSSEATAAW